MEHGIKTYGRCGCGEYRTDPDARVCPECEIPYASNAAFEPPLVRSIEGVDALMEYIERRISETRSNATALWDGNGVADELEEILVRLRAEGESASTVGMSHGGKKP